MADFITKDSGEREDFQTGSRRDTQKGKPRYDLVSPFAAYREAMLLGRGAQKYGERNWELGQPFSRTLASLMRHVEQYRLGDRTEDHLAAVRFNAAALMHYEDMIALGQLPPELNDLPRYGDQPCASASTSPAPSPRGLWKRISARLRKLASGLSRPASPPLYPN